MKTLSRFIASAAVLVALTGCRHSAPQDAAMELKVYAVPPAQTADLASALNASLSTLKARASAATPGKILVYAPHDTQASIGTAIDELAKSTPATPAAQSPLRVSFWMIDAKPGTGEDDPALAAMRGVLDALRVAIGPHHFTLMQSVSGISSNTNSEIRTAGHTFQFSTIRNNQGIRLAVAYGADEDPAHVNQATINLVQTQMTTQLGQYEVMAQTLANASNNATPSEDASPTLHLLVARVDATHPAK